jgi:hypothetical protein
VRRIIFCLSTPLVLTCASCGRSNTIYPVSGRVLCDGVPAKGAVVFFHRRGVNPMDEHVVMGIVQDNGCFELVCGPLGKGAPPGEYDVLVEWKQTSKYKGKGLVRRMPDNLSGRYADRQRPLLRATVEAKRNELPPFQLTSRGR